MAAAAGCAGQQPASAAAAAAHQPAAAAGRHRTLRCSVGARGLHPSPPQLSVPGAMSYEFHYFDFDGGRGPICRIALHASGLPWVDVRVKGADFGAAKAEGKYMTGLPVLKLPSGRIITQSTAIARFAAKHGDAGLYPTDPEAALLVDELICVAEDALTKTPSDPDQEIKKTKREEYAAGCDFWAVTVMPSFSPTFVALTHAREQLSLWSSFEFGSDMCTMFQLAAG
eukprot:SAG31_NODE_2136_length_6360_cov_5.316882_5_plen_227_part_00